MEKKTIVITGASDGIGLAAARELKAQGHTVILVGRNEEKTKRAAQELSVPYHTADYAILSDVVRLAKELSAYEKIDVLCNNAGGALNERTLTKDGIERTFQVNVLAQFLLTNLLIDKLIESKATVIQTSSIASNLFGMGLDMTDIQNEKHYTPVKAYGEAKLCDALFTRELNRLYKEKGISAVAFEPGVVRSNFASESTWYFRLGYHTPLKYLFTISTKQSAKRLVRLAVGTPDEDFISGEVYSYKKPYKIKYQDDGSKAKALWAYMEGLVKEYLTKE